MKENRGSTLLSTLILIVVAAAAYYIVQTVRQTTQQAVTPFQEANSSLQTQVANLMHPTPTIIPDPITYINRIQAIARLETVQYTAEQVTNVDYLQPPAGSNNPLDYANAYFFGYKKLCQVHGTVIAGIDMQKIQPNDMQLQNGVLYVKLPAPEVFITALDESKTQVFDVNTGQFAKPDSNVIISCLQAAKDKILQAAID